MVAQVYGPAGEVLAELTVEKLQAALVFHVLPDLKEAGSAWADAFLAYLRSPDAGRRFEQHGFTPIGPR